MERELGPIRAWVNNAMSTMVNPADQITPDEYRRVTETTYLSQVYGTLAALRYMKRRDRGAIIQVSSGLAIRAAPLQAPYCAAKFAVSGFTDALRCELIHDRVNVSLSVVYLPAVNTPQFNWARNRTGHRQYAPDPVFDPRLCAEAILYAVEHPRREVWVGRSSMMMAAAQALAPALADRKAASMWSAQLSDETIPEMAGNLYEAVPGPAGIDGRFTGRTKASRAGVLHEPHPGPRRRRPRRPGADRARRHRSRRPFGAPAGGSALTAALWSVARSCSTPRKVRERCPAICPSRAP